MYQKQIVSVESGSSSGHENGSSGNFSIGYPPDDIEKMIWEVTQNLSPDRMRFQMMKDKPAKKDRVRKGTICPF